MDPKIQLSRRDLFAASGSLVTGAVVSSAGCTMMTKNGTAKESRVTWPLPYVQLDPEDDAAYLELGETYLKLKKGKEAARAFYRAIYINPDNLDAQLKYGQILLLRQETGEARKKAELFLEAAPDNIEALHLLAGVQIQEKDPDAALKTLEKAISIAPWPRWVCISG